ncbi:protein FAR1-RELATED SEQUENCE 9-like [Chenopodium quinoa]|uniref:protein FAR1-RELATED SEQUENCE 9-like n=1 Tax=Chenopodium quinoa TaxID=63459 RepID=UPI000B7932F0|nr:protein FAR1-RELATED SEQUENCE 9-like [Chenopodium quinoa]
MSYQSEFCHDSDSRFVNYDLDNDDIDNGGEFEDIVTDGEGFTEAKESELLHRKVKSDEEAYDLYNRYAFKHGFGTRKGKLNTREDKVTIRQRFCQCSYVGFKRVNKPGAEPKVYKKRDFRTGCKAMIQFDVDKDSGLFVVVKHLMEHNHSRVPVSKRHLIRSHRKVTGEQVAMLSSLTENGITIAEVVRVLKGQAGGHLQSFFFRDSRMKVDYEAFGDLLVHDTTYRTNKYAMICGPFVGMNHHNNNVMFGIGFLINEKWESFVWLFNTFLKSMRDKHPVTLMTDQAQAMAKAIKIVFPNTRHRLCTWHIGENAKKNIKGLKAKDGFNDLFDIVLKYTDTMAEFEHYWSSMTQKYNCKENKWLSNLYNIREMWCPAYSKDYFSGGILSSQRSETTNKSVSHRLHVTHGLCDFYNSFLEVVDEWRRKESSKDYDSMTGNRHLVWADVGLLEHARKVYTIQVYLQFEDNFVNGVPCTAKVIAMQPPLYEYHVGHPKKDLIMHTVTFDESTVTVECTCKHFGEVGLLCKHSLRVLHLNNITYIPKRYIVKRWTKAAMCTRVDDNVVAESGITPSNVWRLHSIRTFIRLVDRGQNDITTRTVIEEAIDDCTNRIDLLLRKDEEETTQCSNVNDESATQYNGDGNLLEPQDNLEECVERIDVGDQKQVVDDIDVKDPVKRRKKGQRNTRLKSTQEKICNKLKGQKIKSWKKKSARGVSKMKQKAQTTIKGILDSMAVPQGNILAHSSEFGGSLEYVEPDEYFGINISPF